MVASTANRNRSGALSKSQLKAKKGVHKRIGDRKPAQPQPDSVDAAPASTEKKVGGSKNGDKRTVLQAKGPAFYPAADVRTPKASRKTIRPAKLRASITPGTVLILLAGKHRGKRVVCLKQLQPSGLLLVTGPFKLNGVPLRRVNPAYVIATSTKLDVSSVKLDDKLNDAYFKTPALRRSRGSEAEFFAGAGSSEATKQSRRAPAAEGSDASKKADQKSVDSALLAEIAKVEHLGAYLRTTFGLKKGQHPHLMKF